jgi:hypothetical protein
VTTSIIDRSLSIAYLSLLLTVGAVFVLPLVLPIAPPLSIALAILGFVFTMYAGRGGYSVIAGAVVAWSLVGFLIFDTTPDEASGLEEPIPVPSGYGFELDRQSTNVEHIYESRPMSNGQARTAAADILDYYITGLAPTWTVVDGADPDSSTVTLREGDSSRGIGIHVGVVERMGRPAILDLRIQARTCTKHSTFGLVCTTAYVGVPEPYPSGGRIDPST